MARPAEIAINVKSNAGPELRRTAAELRQAEKEAARAARAIQQVQQEATRLGNASVAKVDREFQQLQKSLYQTRDAQRALLRANGDYEGSLAAVTAELARTEQGTRRYLQLAKEQISTQKQLDRAQEASRASIQSLQGSITGLGSSLAVVSGVVAGSQIIRFGTDAIRAANDLERTKAVVRELSGSTGKYDEVLRLAVQGQNLYGGSLKEQLDGLRGLVPLSKNAGIALGDLDQVSRKLAMASPEQGLEGAAVALKEFATGDGADAVLSLAERFELPRKALQQIIATSPNAEARVKALSDLLAQQGFTNAALAASANTTAASYDRLGSAASNAKDRIGAFLAEAFKPAAEAATQVLTGFNGTQESFFRLAEGADFFSKSLFGLQNQSLQLTEEQKRQIGTILEWVGIESEATLKAQEHTAALVGDADASIGLSNALAQATIKLQEQQVALQDDAAKALISDANSQLLTQTKTQLAAQADVAAKALLNAGAAGAQEAARLAASSSLVDQLTAAHYRLAVAAQASSAAQTRQNAMLRKDSDINGQPGRPLTADELQAQRAANAAVAQANAQADARRKAIEEANRRAQQGARRRATPTGGLTRSDRATLTGGSDEEDLAFLRRKLATLRKGSIEAKEVEAKIRQIQQRLAKRGARAGAADDRQAERLDRARDALRTDEEKLAARRAEISKTTDEETRLTLTREIRDLEEKISEEREKQAKSAIDARLAQIDDRKKRRDEERELTQARRVLENGNASAEQKAAARDVLERIPLEQQKRALEIAEKTRDAGGAVAPIAGTQPPGSNLPATQIPRAGLAVLPVTQPRVSSSAIEAAQSTVNFAPQIIVELDGEQLAAKVRTRIGGNTGKLRVGLQQALAGGTSTT